MATDTTIDKVSDDGPVGRFTYRSGEFGTLWVIFIVNTLLSIVTLGMFRFWALTRVRRFLWSRVFFAASPFEYTGTGWELFVGFLKVLFLIFIPAALALGVLNFIVAGTPHDWIYLFLQVAAFLFFMWLYRVGDFLSFRYRVNRTSWRGIRGRVAGSALNYGTTALGFVFLSVVTLGLAQPIADARLARLKYGALRIGSWPTACALEPGRLYPTYLACWSVVFVAAAFVFGTAASYGMNPVEFLFLVLFTGFEHLPWSKDLTLTLIILEIGFFAVVIIGIVAFLWYMAKLTRETMAATRIGDIRLGSDLTGWNMLWFSIGNWLILVFSLGLLLPWTWAREVRLFTDHTMILDPVPVDELIQSAHDVSSIGEELAVDFEVV